MGSQTILSYPHHSIGVGFIPKIRGRSFAAGTALAARMAAQHSTATTQAFIAFAMAVLLLFRRLAG